MGFIWRCYSGFCTCDALSSTSRPCYSFAYIRGSSRPVLSLSSSWYSPPVLLSFFASSSSSSPVRVVSPSSLARPLSLLSLSLLPPPPLPRGYTRHHRRSPDVLSCLVRLSFAASSDRPPPPTPITALYLRVRPVSACSDTPPPRVTSPCAAVRS